MKKNRIALDTYKGHWALVTGASSGIGLALCERFAALGLNLVLVARRGDRLDALSAELAAGHGISTLALPIDLSLGDAAERIKDATRQAGITIRLLCNNAAFGYWGNFEANTPDVYRAMAQVNAAAPAELCLRFYPDLASFDDGMVLNVSSTAVFQPVPYMAVYAATKASLHNFSLALYGEWLDKDILVQTLLPGPTETEFDEKAGGMKIPNIKHRQSPAEVAAIALRHLGDYRRPLIPTGKGVLKQRLLAALVPPGLLVKSVAGMFNPAGVRKP